MIAPLDVLVFGSAADEHTAAVVGELRRRGRNVDAWCARDVLHTGLTWIPGEGFSICGDGPTLLVDRSTAVWWRRPGVPCTAGMIPEEGQLVRDEVAAILPGLAVSETGRCVDDPWNIDRAANKLLQLSVADELGVAIPSTVVTNTRDTLAGRFEGREIIAKALSSGVGLAPFAASLTPDDWDYLAACPTQVQERITARVDLRVVTIGSQVMAWERCRSDRESLDWRQADPAGAGFRQVSGDPTEGFANAISVSLGLTFSVQDWLLGASPVFLEVNPQGQWLFLPRAHETVTPVLARLLLGELDA